MLGNVWQVLFSFSQIGLTALGGGNSMIKLIEDECVRHRAWLSLEEFASIIGVSYLFPGLTVVKLSGMIGLKVAGIPGMVAGVIGVTLPGLLLCALCYSFIMYHRESWWAKKLLNAMQYGAIALFAAALFSLVQPLGSQPGFSWSLAGLAIILFGSVALANVSPFLGIVVFSFIALLLP